MFVKHVGLTTTKSIKMLWFKAIFR